MHRIPVSAAPLLTAVVFSACFGPTGPDPDSPLPVIEQMLVNIGTYDSTTNRAGDIDFRGGDVFIAFGKLLEGTNGLKRTPELTFYVAEGTPVRAPASGVVSQIDVLYSDDYMIVLQQSHSDWEIGVEHVVDPLVSVGDTVNAGDIIATATPENTPGGMLAFTELAVWLPADTDEAMIKVCPFRAFDTDLQAAFSDQIYALAEAWEDYWGQDVFDEASWVLPGCVIDEMTEAEGRNPGGS